MTQFTRREASGSLSDAWESEAEQWVAWVRKPGHDSYWTFHRDVFRRLLPAPAGRALDVGCGEGRLPRDMKSWGYDVVGVDASPTLIRYGREADPGGEYLVSTAADLPFAAESFDLVTAFMSLHDIDEAADGVREMARVLVPDGRLCIAVIHPMSSAGKFDSREKDGRFVIEGSYLEPRRYADTVERDGLRMTFNSQHRPLQAYVDMLAGAGLLIERLVEVPDSTDEPGARWRRLPLFLHLRAVKA